MSKALQAEKNLKMDAQGGDCSIKRSLPFQSYFSRLYLTDRFVS